MLLLTMQIAVPETHAAVQQIIEEDARLKVMMGNSQCPTQEEYLRGGEGDPDFNWGRYLATGKPEFIRNILKIAFSQLTEPEGDMNLIAYAARWSLQAMSMQQQEVGMILSGYFKDAPDEEVLFFFENADDALRVKLLGKERASKLPPQSSLPNRGICIERKGNPFQGIFDEECFKRYAADMESRLRQLEEMLVEDSADSSPEDIRLFMDCFYRGKPLPAFQGEIPEVENMDCWAEYVRAMRLYQAGRHNDYAKALSGLGHAFGMTSLSRVFILEFLSKCYAAGSSERKRYEREQIAAIEEAVREGLWKGRVCYQWYYNFCSVSKDCGDRFWGELEARLKPIASEIDPWFWEMVQGRAGIFWAWTSRGGGWADSVPQEGWEGFGRYLKEARGHFNKALELHPDWANPHISLIKVEMGSGEVEDVIREMKAVLRIDPTNRAALDAGLWAMLPRWGGSHELIKMLAMEALNCPNRASGVPAMGYECLAEIAWDYVGYGWQNVYLEQDVRKCAETLFEEYKSRLRKENYLSARMWHELAELRYDDAAKTLVELGGEAIFRPNEGWQQGPYWDSPIGTPRYDDFGIRIRLFTGQFGTTLRSLERDLLAGRRESALPQVRSLIEEKALPADEQDFLLDWYARWCLDYSPHSYAYSSEKKATAFSVAVENDRADVVREMLDLGFDWKRHENYPGELANTIASNCSDSSMLVLLKEAGDPLNRQKPDTGYAPIHCASAHGRACMVEALLDAGIDVETRCRDGHTPLHTASVMKNYETMKVLLARGANVNAQDNDGDTCLIYLPQLQCPPNTYQFFLEQPDIDVNLANRAGETPMHLMAKWNTSQSIFEMMLSKGAEINARNNRGETPLDLAERSGNIGLVQFLRSKGAKSGGELPPMKRPEFPKNQENGSSRKGGMFFVLCFVGTLALFALATWATLAWRKRCNTKR